jgi:GTP cyclohydrolase II
MASAYNQIRRPLLKKASEPYISVVSTLVPILEGVILRADMWLPITPTAGNEEVLLLEHRKEGDVSDVPLVRIHSACFTGDVLGSLRCDCGPQLEQSLMRIANADWGILAYAVGHEGRGIGLISKLRAYALQDAGFDTIHANLVLGHDADQRDYSAVAAVLTQHGVKKMRLMTSNPEKVTAMTAAGIEVWDEPLDVSANPFNAFYLATKRRWFEAQREELDAESHNTQDVLGS